MARVNYQRDKRQRDLARQRKQEEKRLKKTQKDPLTGENVAVDGTAPDDAAAETDPVAPEQAQAE